MFQEPVAKNNLDEWELNLSALIDGELESDAILPTIDRLLEHGELREFYIGSRKFQQRLARQKIAKPVKTALPDGLWEKIERNSRPNRTRIIQLFPKNLRVLAAAAILIIAGVFAGRYSIQPFRLPFQSNDPIVVQVGEDKGRMNDQRFLALTVEVLRSDNRYQRKMMEVLEAINPVNPTLGEKNYTTIGSRRINSTEKKSDSEAEKLFEVSARGQNH